MDSFSHILYQLNELVAANIRERKFLQRVIDEDYNCNYPLFICPSKSTPVIVSKINHQQHEIERFQEYVNWYISNYL